MGKWAKIHEEKRKCMHVQLLWSRPTLCVQGSPCDCWAQWEFQYPMWVPTVPLVGLVTDLLG